MTSNLARILLERFDGLGESILDHTILADHGTSIGLVFRSYVDHKRGHTPSRPASEPLMIWLTGVRSFMRTNDFEDRIWDAQAEWTWSMDEVSDVSIDCETGRREGRVTVVIYGDLGWTLTVDCAKVDLVLPGP
jgi:hypothetical protein